VIAANSFRVKTILTQKILMCQFAKSA